MMRLGAARLLSPLLVLAGLSACTELAPEGPCEPGFSEPCACSGARESVRVCRFDGRFSACLCPGEPNVDPGSLTGDGGAVADAGLSSDAGAASDAGVSADAGLFPDAGAPDDAGVVPDGGRVDAGLVRDGGAAVDAGVGRDGGVLVDGGVDGGVQPLRAFALATALNRIVIARPQSARNLCTLVTLVQGGGNSPPAFPLGLPMGWSLERVLQTDRASDCTSLGTPPNRVTRGTDGTGSVAFEENSASGLPCFVDVDLMLNFRRAPNWADGQLRMLGTRVPVQDANCP